VLAIAPDESAKKAAKGLTSPRAWSDTGSTETLIWGKCQGSGKDPYQVSVDLNGPAFRCTCPSRKFPCKHGLALLLLWAANDGAVGDTMAAAGFAQDWADQRADKGEKAAARAEKKAEQLAAEVENPELREKREAARVNKITAGLDDLSVWMSDLVRQGLGQLQSVPYSFWDLPAARLVDAQAPGVADRVRDLPTVIRTRTDWIDALLEELGTLHLVIEGWSRRDHLPEDLGADLRTSIGWARSLDEVRARGTVSDDWVVLGVRQDGEGKRIRTQRTWLWGTSSRQFVVLLDFATGGGGFAAPLVTATTMRADIAMFPGSHPRRGICDDPGVGHPLLSIPPVGCKTIAEARQSIIDRLAANPWVERIPIVLHNVRFALTSPDAESGRVIDAQDESLPVWPNNPDTLWRLLLQATGQQISLVCEWEAGRVFPLSVTSAEGWVAL
jgi:hypothetical protein